MKKQIVIVALTGLAVMAGSAFAQGKVEAGRDIKTKVEVGAAVQNAQGMGIEQKMNVGGVKGNVKAGRDIQTNVKAGAVVQNAQGMGIKQDMNIGGVDGGK